MSSCPLEAPPPCLAILAIRLQEGWLRWVLGTSQATHSYSASLQGTSPTVAGVGRQGQGQ